MPLEPPRSLSPSKVTSFRDCALAFRFSAVDRLPEEPTVWTVRGTLVHQVLEHLYWEHRPGERTLDAAAGQLRSAWARLQSDPDFEALGLPVEEGDAFRAEAWSLVENYFALEDPNDVNPVGVELLLEAHIGGLRLRGIIDRLDVTSEGDLIVVDYKTGRAPSPAHEQSRLIGVHIYALLCQEVLGRCPAEVRLLHLREPISISTVPSEQSIRGQRQRTTAVWEAIQRACRDDDFRPRPSPLCDFCNFRAFCPAHGGNPEEAALALGLDAVGAA